MKSIKKVKASLEQLKANAQQYNLTEEDIQKVDKALADIAQLEKEISKKDLKEEIKDWSPLIFEIVRFVWKMLTGNSS